jgi:hypothetical protein
MLKLVRADLHEENALVAQEGYAAGVDIDSVMLR